MQYSLYGDMVVATRNGRLGMLALIFGSCFGYLLELLYTCGAIDPCERI